MYQFFVEPGQIQGNTVTILGNDVNHIRNVLRMQPGEEISVSNGLDGKEYRCSITRMDDENVICSLMFIKEDGIELPARVTLFQCLPKGDKMELIIQKAVELGVFQIVPVASKRCVVKLEEKKAAAKVRRWQGIAEAAAKQSKRRIIPEVASVMTFRESLVYAASMDVKLLPYELAEGMEKTKGIIGSLKEGQRIAVFIGPEGGFEEDEAAEALKAGFASITLGRRILRTETAGLTVMGWIMYQLE